MSFNILGNAATATNITWSGITSKPTTRSGYGITDAANSAAPLEAVMSSGTMAASAGLPIMVVSATGLGHAAMMSFHRPGNFAANFGLDTDNVWKVGGWSMGAVSYPIYHAGNPQVNISGNAATATTSAACSGTAANNALLAGSSAQQFNVADGTSGQNAMSYSQVITSAFSILQTWQSFVVGTGRILGTNYTSGAKAITVIVNGASIGSGYLTPTVGGVALASSYANAGYSTAQSIFIVPPNTTYSVAQVNIWSANWFELK